MKEVCKNYKPEILTCPKCGSKLYYRHTVSDKLVYFSNGKKIRIKNLGYSCPRCNDHIYLSQTANKLCFKGYTYSAKLVCLVAKLKEQHLSRENICDYFFSKNILISDRNVDNLYHKYISMYNINYLEEISKAYEKMLKNYNQIRLSIDLITIDDEINIIVYDYFTTAILALKHFLRSDEENIYSFLGSFLNSNLNITLIATIRKDNFFVPMLKSLCPNTTKFIAFSKF